MAKWIYLVAGAAAAAGFFIGNADRVVAQVRAALVQDVLMQGFQPFNLECTVDTPAIVTTRSMCTTGATPAGKRFVVEHLSGYFVTGSTDVVDRIWVSGGGAVVYLPTHFESRGLNFGGTFGVGRYHQFGSPARLYVASGQTLTVFGDSNRAGRLSVEAVGYLVNE